MSLTLADLALRVANEITDVIRGTASAGSATTLTDTALKYPDGYFTGGTIFFLSGTHAGKYATVTNFSAGVVTFATMTTSVGTARYAIIDKTFPINDIIKSCNAAIQDDIVKVTGTDQTLTGDGSTVVFTLPTGVEDVKAVEFVDTGTTPYRVTPNHRWKERNGELIFDHGQSYLTSDGSYQSIFAPPDDNLIRVIYRKPHAELTTYSDSIDSEINENWLKLRAAEEALKWAIRVKGENPAQRFPQFLQDVREKIAKTRPMRKIDVIVRTA